MKVNINNLVEVDVIASFESHPQEWFSIYIPTKHLTNQETMLAWLMDQLDTPTDTLYKISLCWLCDEKAVKKYKTIDESIHKNWGKYYFKNGILEENADEKTKH